MDDKTKLTYTKSSGMVSYNVTLLLKKTVLLNIHEFTVEGGTFADLLCITEDVKEVNTKLEYNPSTSSHAQFEVEPEPIMTKKPGPSIGTGGRPLKHKQFPLIVTNTINYVKVNGFAAGSRCCNAIGRSCGFTLREIKLHLEGKVPG